MQHRGSPHLSGPLLVFRLLGLVVLVVEFDVFGGSFRDATFSLPASSWFWYSRALPALHTRHNFSKPRTFLQTARRERLFPRPFAEEAVGWRGFQHVLAAEERGTLPRAPAEPRDGSLWEAVEADSLVNPQRGCTVIRIRALAVLGADPNTLHRSHASLFPGPNWPGECRSSGQHGCTKASVSGRC